MENELGSLSVSVCLLLFFLSLFLFLFSLCVSLCLFSLSLFPFSSLLSLSLPSSLVLLQIIFLLNLFLHIFCLSLEYVPKSLLIVKSKRPLRVFQSNRWGPFTDRASFYTFIKKPAASCSPRFSHTQEAHGEQRPWGYTEGCLFSNVQKVYFGGQLK